MQIEKLISVNTSPKIIKKKVKKLNLGIDN